MFNIRFDVNKLYRWISSFGLVPAVCLYRTARTADWSHDSDHSTGSGRFTQSAPLSAQYQSHSHRGKLSLYNMDHVSVCDACL